MSSFFDCSNIINNRMIVDCIRISKGDAVLFALTDLNFREIISFIHLQPILNERIKKRVYIGIPSKYEFIKSLYPNPNFYIIKINQLESYFSKFNIIVKVCVKNRKYSDVFEFYRSYITDFDYNSITPIKFNSRLNNEYSDIIGMSIQDMTLDIYDTSDIVTTEILDCSLFCEKFKLDFNNENIQNVNYKQPSGVSTCTPFDKSTINNINTIISNMSLCKYYVGFGEDLFILAYLVLGADRCILIETNDNFFNHLSFIKNMIKINEKYRYGSIKEQLSTLYAQI